MVECLTAGLSSDGFPWCFCCTSVWTFNKRPSGEIYQERSHITTGTYCILLTVALCHHDHLILMNPECGSLNQFSLVSEANDWAHYHNESELHMEREALCLLCVWKWVESEHWWLSCHLLLFCHVTLYVRSALYMHQTSKPLTVHLTFITSQTWQHLSEMAIIPYFKTVLGKSTLWSCKFS